MPPRADNEPHVHDRRRAIRGGLHFCGAPDCAAMRARAHRVATHTQMREVYLLEVSCRLVEPEDVQEVVHIIAEVEDIQHLLVIAEPISRKELDHVSVERPGK